MPRLARAAPNPSLFDRTRSADVITLPRQLATTTFTPVSGTVYGTRAAVIVPGTFSQVRFNLGTAWTSTTDARVAVWSTDGTLLSESANESVALNAVVANGNFIVSLASAVTLSTGTDVVLGIGVVGQATGALRAGVSMVTGNVTALAPRLTRSKTGYAGGTLGTLPDVNGSLQAFWTELIP